MTYRHTKLHKVTKRESQNDIKAIQTTQNDKKRHRKLQKMRKREAQNDRHTKLHKMTKKVTK